MNDKILFVDDDANILEAYKRQLRKSFAIETALGGKAGLEAVHTQEPFAVVVSDLRMPEMDGIQFLAAVREHEPDTVRCMLTGQADLEATIQAVNDNNLFRFLTKPCPPEELTKALADSLAQYHLVTAEREILEQTLTGSVEVLTEILSFINPTAFGCASRIKRYIRHMAEPLRLSHTWEFELAGLLSQIGCVSLPADLLNRMYAGQKLSPEEQELFAAHPQVAGSLLAKIPRLTTVAAMIEGVQQPVDLPTLAEHLKQGDVIGLGAQMLLVALDFDRPVARGASSTVALGKMRQRKDRYLPRLLSALENIELAPTFQHIQAVKVLSLRPGMILDEDVFSRTGSLLLAKGHQITESIIAHLRNFTRTTGVVEPIRVILPQGLSQEGH